MMRDNKLSAPIYKILLLFEDTQNEASNIKEQDYLNYLDRLSVRYLGYSNIEIYQTIRGLYLLGSEAHHDTVKRAVFHIINLVQKEAAQ